MQGSGEFCQLIAKHLSIELGKGDSDHHHHHRTTDLEGTLWTTEISPCQGGPVGELNSQPLASQPET